MIINPAGNCGRPKIAYAHDTMLYEGVFDDSHEIGAIEYWKRFVFTHTD